MNGGKNMELTIKIADAEYKELSVIQKRGLAELLQLDGTKGQNEAEEPEKPKKRRRRCGRPGSHQAFPRLSPAAR